MKFVSKSPTPYTISLKRNKIVLLFKVNYFRESGNRYLYKSIKSVSLENIYTSGNIQLRHRINTATYFNTLYCLSYRRPIREFSIKLYTLTSVCKFSILISIHLVLLTRRICLTIKSFFSWWSFPFWSCSMIFRVRIKNTAFSELTPAPYLRLIR